EVARLYPELVDRDAHGAVITVRYHELIPMLLNEVQKQTRLNQEQARQIYSQAEKLDRQDTQLRTLQTRQGEDGKQRAMLERRLARLEQALEARSGAGGSQPLDGLSMR